MLRRPQLLNRYHVLSRLSQGHRHDHPFSLLPSTLLFTNSLPGNCYAEGVENTNMRFRAYSTDSEAELSSDDDDARRVDEEVGSASDTSDDDNRRLPAPQARQRQDSPVSESSASDPEDSDEEPGPRRRPVVQFDPAIKSPPQTHTQRALADPTLIPWAREIGVDAQKMHVMQAALFRVPEEEAALKAASRLLPRRRVSVFAGLSQKRGRDSEGEGLRTEFRQVR